MDDVFFQVIFKLGALFQSMIPSTSLQKNSGLLIYVLTEIITGKRIEYAGEY